jgi:acyl-CoA thioester hydrolase
MNDTLLNISPEDLTGSNPRVAPMPDDIAAKMRAVFEAHSALPRPERIGRRIGIPRKA